MKCLCDLSKGEREQQGQEQKGGKERKGPPRTSVGARELTEPARGCLL